MNKVYKIHTLINKNDYCINTIYIVPICKQKSKKINNRYRKSNNFATILSIIYDDYAIIYISISYICNKHSCIIKNIYDTYISYVTHAICNCLINEDYTDIYNNILNSESKKENIKY